MAQTQAATAPAIGRKPEARAVDTPSRPRKILRCFKRLFLNRFTLMVVFPMFGLFFIWIFAIEPNRLMYRQETVSAQSLGCRPPKRPLRIVHISDLHLHTEKSVLRLQKAVEIISRHQPDIVLMTGDYGFPQNQKLLASTEACLAYLRAIAPTFACLGNHDYLYDMGTTDQNQPNPPTMNMLMAAGIHVLQDEKQKIIVNGTVVHVAGLTEWQVGCKPESCLAKRTATQTDQDITLLMCHNHDALTMLQDFQWNVMFSGHTHGGQFRVPFTRWCPFSHVKLKRYTAKGLYDLDGRRMLSVTAGIGNTYEVRLNCFPEVTLLEITP